MSRGLRVLKASTMPVQPSPLELAAYQRDIAAAYESGRSDEREEAARSNDNAELRRVGEGIAELLRTTDELRRETMRADADQIVDAAIDLALWICREALTVPPSLAERISALIVESGHRATSVRVSPKIAAALAEHVDPTVRVTSDPSVNDGDFVLETEGPDVQLVVSEALSSARTLVRSSLNQERVFS